MQADQQLAGSALAEQTVQGIALGPNEVWLITDTALWLGTKQQWHMRPLPANIAHPLALASVGHNLILGGAPAAVAISFDQAGHWQPSWIDAVERSISCLAVSPQYAVDRVLLAGTEGAGMLRSTDGGHSWRVCNAGLQEFTVLALAVAPRWQPREIAFAATTGGLYRTPNGGRAWKRLAFPQEAGTVVALALSADWTEQPTVYAGTETAGLYCSLDGGQSWQPLAARGNVPHEVNCLWCHPSDPAVIIAGTTEGTLLRSANRGADWQCVAAAQGSILALAGDQVQLYAGAYQGGVLISDDGGLGWQPLG